MSTWKRARSDLHSDVVHDGGHRLVVLHARAELAELNGLERLHEVAGLEVVGLTGAHDLLTPIAVGHAERAGDHVAEVRTLAAVVGQSPDAGVAGPGRRGTPA